MPKIVNSETDRSLTEFFRESFQQQRKQRLRVAKRALLEALGAAASAQKQQGVVENLSAESIRVRGRGRTLHVSIGENPPSEDRAEEYKDPLPFTDPWFPNQYALGVAFHDALARSVGKADGYNVAVAIGEDVQELRGPYSAALSKMTSDEKRFKTAEQAIEFVKAISTISFVYVLAAAAVILVAGSALGLAYVMRHPGGGPQTDVHSGPQADGGSAAIMRGRGGAAEQGRSPEEPRTVELPDELGGKITRTAMDAIVKAAPSLKAFAAVIMLDKEGAAPVYRYGDALQAAYACKVPCLGAVMHRDAGGTYTRLWSGALEENKTSHLDRLKVVAPAGKEEMILIVAREPLKAGELDGDPAALKGKVVVSVVEYEAAARGKERPE
jgi:hypothetical protein